VRAGPGKCRCTHISRPQCLPMRHQAWRVDRPGNP
jgi:hypothetical protein